MRNKIEGINIFFILFCHTHRKTYWRPDTRPWVSTAKNDFHTSYFSRISEKNYRTNCKNKKHHNLHSITMVISSRKKLLVAEAVQKAATTLLKPSSRQSTSNVSREKARVYHAPAIPRTRQSVQDIYNCLGPLYFRRAYRMTYDSFCRLHDKLQDKILEKIRIVGTNKIERLQSSKKHEQQKQKRLLNLSSFSSPKQGNFKKKRQQQNGNYKPPPVHNGIISTSVRLACALRYFAGGSAYDLMAKYGISYSSMLESVWYVVDAINSLEEFFIEYPSDHSIQQKIADDFRSASGVDSLLKSSTIFCWMR